MFPKPHRLKSLAIFRRLGRFPVACRSPYALGVGVPYPVYADKPELTQRLRNAPFQFGIVISKKVHKSAVVRNKIRRQLREMIRHDLLPAIDSGDTALPQHYRALIFIVRQKAVGVPYQQLRQSVLSQWVNQLNTNKRAPLNIEQHASVNPSGVSL